MARTPNLDHPTLPIVKEAFPEAKLMATEIRGQTTLVAPKEILGDLFRLLRDDERCDYDFLVDVTAADYLNYPAPQPGRFAVIWVLESERHERRLTVKCHLDPSIDTTGNEHDPALVVTTVTHIWPGAEWREREAYDMYGIRFEGHPDLRRILTWADYPAFPLRKDYPLRGRGERETYVVVHRDDV